MPMITPEFCQMMASYNTWQNEQMRAAAEKLTEAELRADQGAFFGSIMGTMNHLLWGDLSWMARFDGGDFPEGSIEESPTHTPTLAVWSAERFRTDGRIKQWSDKLHNIDLQGDITWFSGSQNRDVAVPLAQAIVHFFNHQTHHRGQVHSLLTAAGQTIGDTDLVFMPQEQK